MNFEKAFELMTSLCELLEEVYGPDIDTLTTEEILLDGWLKGLITYTEMVQYQTFAF